MDPFKIRSSKKSVIVFCRAAQYSHARYPVAPVLDLWSTCFRVHLRVMNTCSSSFSDAQHVFEASPCVVIHVFSGLTAHTIVVHLTQMQLWGVWLESLVLPADA